MEGAIYSISKNDLYRLVLDLEKDFDIYGPVKTNDEAVFSKYRFIKITSSHELALHYSVTTLPPTKYLFPPREGMFEFAAGKIKNDAKTKKKQIIFGLNGKDLRAIYLLDKEFMMPIADELYTSNRKATHLFAIDHFDPETDTKYDLFFKTASENLYEVFVGSDFGQSITEKEHFFKRTQEKNTHLNIDKKSPVFQPDIPELIANSKNDPIWDKLANQCFGCGICSFVCPLCYCFETEDVVKIEGLDIKEPSKCSGCRERRWDSCMLPDFASISSHDFRPELRDRIYNWYHHKFVRTPAEHGFVGCVDCDRCIVFCPAKINFKETLNYLIKKYT